VARNGRKNVGDCIALALASGATVAQAAEKAGCSPRTVYRRLGDLSFCKAVTNLRSEMITQAAGQLAARMGEAVETLQNLLKAESENVRLGAARSILEMAVRFREQLEIEERLRRLEEHLDQSK
jgi:AcrR family transcriptional regulator